MRYLLSARGQTATLLKWKLRSIAHDKRRRVFLTANHDQHSDETDACRVVTAGLMAGRWRSDGFNVQGNGFLSMQKGGDEMERLALACTLPRSTGTSRFACSRMLYNWPASHLVHVG
jgi:hypothetical protein